MIPSRPLDLGGIIGESIRIVKRIYWRAAIFLIIFTLPGLIILSYGIDETFAESADQIRPCKENSPAG